MKNWIAVFLLAFVHSLLANTTTIHYKCTNEKSSMTLMLVLLPDGRMDQENSILKGTGLTEDEEDEIRDTKFKIKSTSESHRLVGHINSSPYVATFCSIASENGIYEAQFSLSAVDGTILIDKEFRCEITQHKS